MRISLRLLALICIFAGAAGNARASNSSDDALSAQVDEVVRNQMREQRIPGVSLAVMRDGKIIKATGYGLANVELNVPVTPQMVFNAGSLTKAFTATAVMMLVEEGKVGLDDKISKYLPEAPLAWSETTIRRLLTHTSGLRDYFGEDGDPKYDFHQDFTEDELVRKFAVQSMRFPAGEQWRYNNAGYVILGVVIHRVTGKFWFDFVKERIFDPLGMTSTRLLSTDDIILDRVSGYQIVNGQQKNAPWFAPSWLTTADGSLSTNVFDMAKWDAALYTEKLIKRFTLQQMWTPVKLNDGTIYPYGFAWRISDVNGHRLIQHDGVEYGFTSRFARYVNDELSVIVFINLGEDDEAAMPKRITDNVAAIYIPGLGGPAIEAVDPAANMPASIGETATGVTLRAEQAPAFTTQQREVWKVSQEWRNAYNRRDLDTFARLTVDDFIGSTDDGIFMSKAGLLKRLSTHPPEADQRKNVRDVRVRVNGDTGVVNYRLSLTEEGFDNGRLIFELRRSEVFQKSNGAWLAIAAHDSLLPINHREPVKADPKTFKEYAGQYEHFRPGFTATYTVEGDHLIDEWKGDKIEAFPMGEDTFFEREDLGWTTFVRDKQARVTGYVYHYADRQQATGKKIK